MEAGGKKGIFRTLAKFVFVACVWLCVFGGVAAIYMLQGVPDVAAIRKQERHIGMHFLARDGTEVAFQGNHIGNPVRYDDLPKHFVDALLATEDRRFFKHFGVDVRGIARAAYSNFRSGKVVQGGSTVTQQLAKLSFLTPERTLRRKVQEMFLALYLESTLSKEEILSLYLSRVYLGNGNYGLEAASRDYFGKDYKNLGLFDSAMIVGMIKAPSLYNPYSSKDRAEARAMQVLYNMVDYGALDEAELARTYAWNPRKSRLRQEYSYFIDWLRPRVEDYIGAPDGEYAIRTTMDSGLQQAAHHACNKHIGAAMRTHPGLNLQCAVVAMDHSGDILAMTGGRSYQESPFNRATQAKRQPGSLFKMFVYTAAMERGMFPYQHMIDRPVQYRGWSPRNWNNRYVGDISLTDAFASSVNSIAVQLADTVGIKRVIAASRKLGIVEDMPANLSVALGSAEATLLDMTTAYAHLAGGGRTLWPQGVIRVDSKGKALYERQRDSGVTALEPHVVNRMLTMLRAVVTRGTGRRANIPGAAIAGKTGTSQNNRDAWFVGFSPDVVVGVWTGRDDNESMPKEITGGTVPAEIFNDVTESYYQVLHRAALPPARLYDHIGQESMAAGGFDPRDVLPEYGARSRSEERGEGKQKGFFGRLWGILRGD
jgi:penicillin-binding protein 1A